MGALNLPSAADIERLTRRLRSVSYRLEGIEDGVARLDRSLAHGGVDARLTEIEEQLETLTRKLDGSGRPESGAASTAAEAGARPTRAPKAGSRSRGAPKAEAGSTAAPKAGARSTGAAKAGRPAKGGRATGKAASSRKAASKGA